MILLRQLVFAGSACGFSSLSSQQARPHVISLRQLVAQLVILLCQICQFDFQHVILLRQLALSACELASSACGFSFVTLVLPAPFDPPEQRRDARWR